MSTRRSRHHVVNVNWVQISVRAPSPITAEEARGIAVRAYLSRIEGKPAWPASSPVSATWQHAIESGDRKRPAFLTARRRTRSARWPPARG